MNFIYELFMNNSLLMNNELLMNIIYEYYL